MLIANQNYKLAVAAKSPNWGLKKFSSFPLNEKFSGFSGLNCLNGLSGLSGLVPNYANKK